MAGVYRPQHPERTVLYRVIFHHFDRFLAEYETRFEKEYGFFTADHLQHPQDAAERETMDYLEFIARVTVPLPSKS
jgi:hypothetical protein